MIGLYQPPGKKVWMFRFQRSGKRRAVSLKTHSKMEARRRARALLENPNHEPLATMKKCQKCRTEKPDDAKHFAPDSRSGKLSPTCRDCVNGKARQRPGRRGVEEGMRGVMRTTEAVKAAFRQRDPDGSEETEFKRRALPFVERFQHLPTMQRVVLVGWLVQEFLKAKE